MERKKHGKKKWIAVVVIAVIVVALVAGAVTKSRRKSKADATSSVKSAEVTTGTIKNTISASGTLEEADTTDIKIPSNITIKKVSVEAGDEIEKGDTLATVDMTSVKEAIYEVRSSISSIDSTLKSIKSKASAKYVSQREMLKAEKSDMNKELKKLLSIKKTGKIKASVSGTIVSVNVSGTDSTAASSSSTTQSSSGTTSSISSALSGITGTSAESDEITAVSLSSKVPVTTTSDGDISEEDGKSSEDTVSSDDSTSKKNTVSLDDSNSKKDTVSADDSNSSKKTDSDEMVKEESNTSDSSTKGSTSKENSTKNSSSEKTEKNKDSSLEKTTDKNSAGTSNGISQEDIKKALEKRAKNNSSSSTDSTNSSSSTGTASNSNTSTNSSTGSSSTTGTSSFNNSALLNQYANGSTGSSAAQSSSALSGAAQNSNTQSSSALNSSALSSLTSGSTGSTTTDSSYDSGVSTVSYTSAFTVSGGDKMDISLSIDELDVLDVEEGQSVTVTLDALDDQEFTGEITKVSHIGTNNGGSTKYTATCQIDKTADMLVGMNATAVIDVESAENVLTIPLSAVQEENGQSYVYTTNDNGTLGGKTTVTTGLSDDTTVEITDGLSEGDTVYYKDLSGQELTSTQNNLSNMGNNMRQQNGGGQMGGGQGENGGGTPPSGGNGGPGGNGGN